MTAFSRRDFLTTTGSALVSLSAAGTRAHGKSSKSTPSADRPNVLILKSDEHNPMISSVHGHPFVHTPNMERLARMGTVYENHYCPSPLCCPSRSSFMSGRHVHEIQTYNNCCVFKFDYPTYGGVLHNQGIHTVLVGKVDVYNRPDTLGFSEMYGTDYRNPGDTNISRNPLTIRPDADKRQLGYGPDENPFRKDDESIDTAVMWLKTKGISLKKPWTLEVNVVKPHFPHKVTKELWDMYEGHEDMPEYLLDCEPAQHPYARDLRAHFQTEKFTENSTRKLRRGYYGCVTYVDRQLGRLLDTLEETELLDNTVVVYTSDHGEMLGKFGMWWKCSLYEDSSRVPLIVAGPGFGKNTRVGTPVDQLDLQASIFRALGCKRPEEWSGSALQDISINDPDHIAFCEYHGHGTRAGAFMIRKGKWKYIHSSAAPNQLFDMDADPDELHNLAENKRNIVREMEHELRKTCSPEEEDSRAEAFILKELAAVR